MMRSLALAFLTMVSIWATGPVRAQTYSPDFPVCLHIYDLGATYFECAYTSLAQCAVAGSGRSAQCVVNPYFADQQRERPRYRRGHG